MPASIEVEVSKRREVWWRSSFSSIAHEWKPKFHSKALRRANYAKVVLIKLIQDNRSPNFPFLEFSEFVWFIFDQSYPRVGHKTYNFVPRRLLQSSSCQWNYWEVGASDETIDWILAYGDGQGQQLHVKKFSSNTRFPSCLDIQIPFLGRFA